MAFEWESFLEVSKKLRHGSKAERRTSVSRAYYAAYGYIILYAKVNLGYRPTEDHNDHTRLKRCLKDAGEVKKANNLGQLKGWRGNCDYDDDISDIQLENLVNKSIDISENLIKYFSKRKQL